MRNDLVYRFFLLIDSTFIRIFRFSFSRPCILIFDSLSSCERNKVICYLREYLKCEYQAKVKSGKDTQFDSTTMPEQYVKVPHQDNTSDCGLFMLHYIEQFFKVCLTGCMMSFDNGTHQRFEKTPILCSIVDRLRNQSTAHHMNSKCINANIFCFAWFSFSKIRLVKIVTVLHFTWSISVEFLTNFAIFSILKIK